ncbi:hypothetical protein [Hugenholtzia roseola]|uniref:hypothetical protein n=1 Tax=Hugenholtzia roseola TaxID=1002 RepID=UPI00041116E6|nr:hypothetical protein [Hugenholtzia roseola]
MTLLHTFRAAPLSFSCLLCALLLLGACSQEKKQENATDTTAQTAEAGEGKVVLAPVEAKTGLIRAEVVLQEEWIRSLCNIAPDTAVEVKHNKAMMLLISNFRWRKTNWQQIQAQNAKGGEIQSYDHIIQVHYAKGQILKDAKSLDEEFARQKAVFAKVKDPANNKNFIERPTTPVEGVGKQAFWEPESKKLLVATSNAVFMVKNSYKSDTKDELAIAKEIAAHLEKQLQTPAL